MAGMQRSASSPDLAGGPALSLPDVTETGAASRHALPDRSEPYLSGTWVSAASITTAASAAAAAAAAARVHRAVSSVPAAARRRARGGSRNAHRASSRLDAAVAAASGDGGRPGRPGAGAGRSPRNPGGGVMTLLFRMRARTASVVSGAERMAAQADEGSLLAGGSGDSVGGSPESSGGTGVTRRTSDERHRVGIGRRRNRLKCLEFDEEGNYKEKYLTRQELINEAMAAGGPLQLEASTRDNLKMSKASRQAAQAAAAATAALSNERMLDRRTRNMRNKGVSRAAGRGLPVAAPNLQPKGKQLMNGLTMRDIRQVDPAFTAKAALWVRRNALVVSLVSVRAVILYNKMYLFDPDNQHVQRPIRYIQQRLADGARNVEEVFVPFELRALEGILIHSCIHLERQFADIEPILLGILGELPGNINADHLEELRFHEQRLNHFCGRSRKVQHVLQTVLDEDEDMAGMYLTEMHKNPDVVRNPIDHDEAEMLLESYLQVVDDLTSKAELLNRAIDDTENLIEIHLDTMQNQLLLVNLLFSVVSTILGFGTMVTGIFGMNLALPDEMSVLPSSQYYFYGVATILAIALPLGLFVLTKWSKRQGVYARKRSINPLRKCLYPLHREEKEAPAVTAVRQRIDRLTSRRRHRSSTTTPIGSTASPVVSLGNADSRAAFPSISS